MTAAGSRMRGHRRQIVEATGVLLALTPAERETLHRLSLEPLGCDTDGL
jgi:hypothetical protein